MLTGAGGPSQPPATDQRDEHSRTPTADGASYNKREDLKPGGAEDLDASDLSSIAESVEMDFMSSDDDLHDDEETGLTAKQKRQRRRRRKQRRQLDARIADVKASQHNIITGVLGDNDVAKKLLVNAGLILLWYFFSLAISIVSIRLFLVRFNWRRLRFD